MNENEIIKVHLDTDLGGDLDDLCALALLLRWPGVKLIGVTTVCEIEGKRAGYTRFALDLDGQNRIPVKSGAETSDGHYQIIPGLPSEYRYWPQTIAPIQNPIEEALDLLEQSIAAGAVIIGIGPYTNLALLEKRQPEILTKANLVLMGGCISPVREGFPQWGNKEDWNIQIDVESARLVLENAERPLLVPLTVTVETALRKFHLPALRKAGRLASLIADQAECFAVDFRNEERYGQTCTGLPEDTINFQHDPLTCAIALG